MRLPYVPGRSWEGQVEFVYPSLDPGTRTLQARLRFPNPDETLKPNMFADVTLYAGARTGILNIPREALIRTGEQERVILALGEGRFKPRQVVSGIESGDWVEILEGLREGEWVVTSGQFLIDSEASLKASIQRMSEPASRLEEGESRIRGTGVVESVAVKPGRVRMHHDPISALDWPSMTMDFRLAEGVSLEGLAAGDAVTFQLEPSGDGYRVVAIRKRDE